VRESCSMRPKKLWWATCTVEVTLSDMSVALALLRSQAAPTTQPPTGYLLDRFPGRAGLKSLPFPSKRRCLSAHSVAIEPTPLRAHYPLSAVSLDLFAVWKVVPRTRYACRTSTRALWCSGRRVDS
jgi:hypothetical protein